MKRILIVSIAAPPKSGPESLQVGKYIKELSKEFTLDLVTTKSSTYGWNKNYGSSINSYRDQFDQVIELPGYSNRFWSRVKLFLPLGLAFPDSNFHFHYFSQRVLQKLNNKPDLIYSRSTPFSSAILAYKLWEKTEIPWVMHLSDPWGDYLIDTKHELWERKCIENASLISVTNDTYLGHLKEKHPTIRSKFITSYNAYDKESEYITVQNKKLTIAYFGNLYGNRSPKPLLNAIIGLEEEDKSNIELRFYGNRTKEIEEDLLTSKISGIKLYSAVEFKKIPELIKDVHLLLNIEDLTIPTSRVLTLPSKVIDTLAYRKKMISIARPGAPSESIIEASNGKSFSADDLDGMRQYIKLALNATSNRNEAFFMPTEPSPKFSIGVQTKLLADNFNSIIKQLE